MRNYGKKLLSLALVLVMALTLLPTAAFAAAPKAGDTTVVTNGETFIFSKPIAGTESITFTEADKENFIVIIDEPVDSVTAVLVPVGSVLTLPEGSYAVFDDGGAAISNIGGGNDFEKINFSADALPEGAAVSFAEDEQGMMVFTYDHFLPGNIFYIMGRHYTQNGEPEGPKYGFFIKLTDGTAEPQQPTSLAYASTQSVTVDGKPVEFQMYALKDASGNDTNYIKLRDMAYILNGTKAQFSVDWDGSISLTTGTAYTANGSEMSTPFSGDRAYEGGPQTLKVNGKDVTLDALVLKDDAGSGYTYFKLRDLGDALGFKVDWVSGKGVIVETGGAAETQTPAQPEENSVTAEVVRLVNAERAKEGLAPLDTFDSLDQAAAIRAQETTQLFSHDRPDGSSCFTALDETGAKQGAHTWGENIACGQPTAAAVVEVWMNSPGHRANILNPDYTHIGVGYVNAPSGYRHYWVQMFVGK